LTAGVDVQKRWLEASVYGWGENKESWLLDHIIINGAPDDPGTWSELERVLANCRYPHPYGTELALFEAGSRVFVDAGHWDQHVLPWTFSKQKLGVAACQGSPTINAPILGKPRLGHNPKAQIYPVGVNQSKDILYRRLTLDPPNDGVSFPPGFIHLNKTATPQFVDGLTAEYGKEERYRGEVFTRYVCPSGKRNEPLDTFVYAYAAMQAIRPRFEKIKENLLSKTQETKPKTKRPTRKRPGRGFIGGFN
jgi:phage terminase large subunit GpA-like protein